MSPCEMRSMRGTISAVIEAMVRVEQVLVGCWTNFGGGGSRPNML